MSEPAHTGAPPRRKTNAEKFRILIESVTGPLTLKNLLSWIGVIAFVLVVRWLWFEPFAIPSDSMVPTFYGNPRFMQGDRVAANKYIYGPRVPFMDKRFFRLQDPQRWDIIIFNAIEPNGKRERLVKRIVGLPGERVEIRNDTLYVNGTPMALPTELSEKGIHYTDRLFPELDQYEPPERLAEVRGRFPFRYGLSPDDEFSLVPTDSYFVLGDNSGNSVDGRYFGWVYNNQIVGRVFCIWWPFAHWRDFTGFSQTWWGKGVLYGIPALVVLYESIQYARRRRAEQAAHREAQ